MNYKSIFEPIVLNPFPKQEKIILIDNFGNREEFESLHEVLNHLFDTIVYDYAHQAWNELDISNKEKCNYELFRDYFWDNLEDFILEANFKLIKE